MKSLLLSVWAGQQITERYQNENGGHLKTTNQNHLNILCTFMGTYVHMTTKYEVSTSNPVTGGDMHRRHQQRQRTKHDCVRLFG